MPYKTKYCRHNGKIIYRTEHSAKSHARKIAKYIAPMRPYRCPYCEKWHLTSQAAASERANA